MQDGEVKVAGPEPDRLTAYFDIDSRLQIFGGGSLSGSTITVLSDTELSGNSDAAEKFGLINPTTRLTGQLFTLTSSYGRFRVKFWWPSCDNFTGFTWKHHHVPSSVTGLTLTWQSESATTGRLKAEYNGDLYSLTFDNPTDALGFKTADREISVSGE